jgi:hypothetical protein
MKRHFISGQYLFKCDRCGKTYYSKSGLLEWNHLFVCRELCYEPRHPQDFVRGLADDQRVEIARPRQTDVFITTPITAADL